MYIRYVSPCLSHLLKGSRRDYHQVDFAQSVFLVAPTITTTIFLHNCALKPHSTQVDNEYNRIQLHPNYSAQSTTITLLRISPKIDCFFFQRPSLMPSPKSLRTILVTCITSLTFYPTILGYSRIKNKATWTKCVCGHKASAATVEMDE